MKKIVIFSNLIVISINLIAAIIIAMFGYINWSKDKYYIGMFSSNFWYIFFLTKMVILLCLVLFLIILFTYRYKNGENKDMFFKVFKETSSSNNFLYILTKNKALLILCIIINTINFALLSSMFSFAFYEQVNCSNIIVSFVALVIFNSLLSAVSMFFLITRYKQDLYKKNDIFSSVGSLEIIIAISYLTSIPISKYINLGLCDDLGNNYYIWVDSISLVMSLVVGFCVIVVSVIPLFFKRRINITCV